MSITSYRWNNNLTLSNLVDVSISKDNFNNPYRLVFPLGPQYPQYINEMILDMTGSYLDPNCLDPQDPKYIYPLFSRIMVTANGYDDVYFDRIYPYTPRDGKEWNGLVYLNLNRTIVYPTIQTFYLLLFPSICKTHIPRLNNIVFSYETPPSPKSRNSLTTNDWVYVGLGIAIVFFLMIIVLILIKNGG